MTFRKAKGIPEYRPGENVNDLFVVRFKKPVRTTRSGNFFFQLKIQDALGDAMLSYFGGTEREPVQEIYDSIEENQVIRVLNGRSKEYKGSLSFTVDDSGSIEPLEDNDFVLEDFLRTSKRETGEMVAQLREMVASVESDDLRALLNSFFADEAFMVRFSTAPGAMYKHHGWISGLLEHTLAVATIAREYADIRPELDKDLVTAGALLHDVGKLEELETTTTIKVSDVGNLLGHIVLGVQMAAKRFEEVDAPEKLKMKLFHMMLSHHGENEYGSPKVPAFPEAMVVYYADAMDAMATNMVDIRENAETEDSFIYDKKLGNVYLK